MSSKPRSASLVSMAAAGGRQRALFLAVVAALGLAIGPVLHAEAHLQEEEDEEAGTAPDHHSHGPGSGESHGAGTLEHLSIALHASPQLPVDIAARMKHPPPMPLRAQRQGTLPHLVPEWPQAPPVTS